MLPHHPLGAQDSWSRFEELKCSFAVTVLACRNFLLGWRSPAAPIENSFERSKRVQFQDVGALGSCWIRAVVCAALHRFLNCACLSCGVILWVFPRSTCDFVPTCHGFARAALFLHALSRVCFLTPSICTTIEIMQCSSEMMIRGLALFTFCLVRPLALICHCKPLQGTITCAVVSFNVFFVFSADFSSRIPPHAQKDFPFSVCVFYKDVPHVLRCGSVSCGSPPRAVRLI